MDRLQLQRRIAFNKGVVGNQMYRGIPDFNVIFSIIPITLYPPLKSKKKLSKQTVLCGSFFMFLYLEC